MEELVVTRKSIPLPGGRAVTVARYTSEDGRSAIVLRAGWPDPGPPVPEAGGDVLTIPGDSLPDLVAALEELQQERS